MTRERAPECGGGGGEGPVPPGSLLGSDCRGEEVSAGRSDGASGRVL